MTAKRVWVLMEIQEDPAFPEMTTLREVYRLPGDQIPADMVERGAWAIHRRRTFAGPPPYQTKVWARDCLVAALTVEGDGG